MRFTGGVPWAIALQLAGVMVACDAFQTIFTPSSSGFRQQACSLGLSGSGNRMSTSARKGRSILRMSEDIDMSAFFAEVERRDEAAGGGEAMDGPELRRLVMDKWKIHRRRDAFGKQTVWLQVMWKHLWEQSFPMTEEEYDAQLDAVAWYITEWGKADYVREEIEGSEKEPGLTVNGGAKTVMINLNVSEEQAKLLYDD